jgi:pimeloyl-ACP methyl ester carboxylesterase
MGDLGMTTYHAPGAIFEEREHHVPLDHGAPDGARITVFTREVAAPDGGDRPYLVFLQGGPGFEATRPTSPPTGWMKRALQDYRVLLLDQRGTGRSTPVGPTIPGDTPQAQAEYLTHFRADSIVRDCEAIRGELGIEQWSVLGQSFGGFTSMTYLSIAPEGLREAFITGGLSPIGRPVDDIYGATYRRLIVQNRRYFDRYPDDRERVREITRRLDAEDVRLAQTRIELRPRTEACAVRVPGLPPRCRRRRQVRPEPDLRHAARVVVRGWSPDSLVRRPPPAG